MNKFGVIAQELTILVKTCGQFEGFKIPTDLNKKIGRAEDEKNSHLAGVAHDELSKVLRAFVKNSPTFFNGKVASLMYYVDEDLAKALRNALKVYTKSVEKAPKFEIAADLYAGLTKYLKVIESFQVKRREEKVEAYELALQKRNEAIVAAARARDERWAKMLDYIRNGEFVQIDASLP